MTSSSFPSFSRFLMSRIGHRLITVSPSTIVNARMCSSKMQRAQIPHFGSGFQRAKFSSSVDQREIEGFSDLASSWWDEAGPLKALHSMNTVRVPWIKDTLLASRAPALVTSSPLSGFAILDVGCGAGILSEPLARLGATVTGMDASPGCIDAALGRLASDPKLRNCKLQYLQGSPEESHSTEGTFDAVVASEILEHVADRQTFLAACVRQLKPGGYLFITTLAPTVASRFLGIYAAEYVLGLVPAGTHDWDKFTSPEDLCLMLEREGCDVRLIHGLLYNPVCNAWSWIGRKDINYGLHAIKSE